MTIRAIASICALINLTFLLSVFWIMSARRKSGKSDIHQSRISLVVASFLLPIIICFLFVATAAITQLFFNFSLPVGSRGEGVFVVLITSVLSSVITLVILLPRIRHRWNDG